jgi:hypothetical protein
MHLGSRALFFAACLCVAISCHARLDSSGQAWFYSDVTSKRWCSVVKDTSAEAFANSGRFDGGESGWLRYRGGVINSIVIMLQSEDAYVEDTYTFGPDLTIKKVVRRGHYVGDPFISAVFKPDGRMQLKMIPRSQKAVQSWGQTQEIYFFDWPIYSTFSQIPFAGLISTKPVSVFKTCLP